ncbi:cysteine proteinase 2-like [Choristoneura fumiferana]|uniref:cysteine proteinase 2-like n=1 Tax=Choristoneura fumiferana TaxID=7141 RepID=UPI003D15C09D
MHDEEASKWQAVFWYHYQDVGYEVFTIWVTERQGVFVPLRSSSVSVYEKIRTFSYIDYFDYDVSDIDPEIWNIKKGMDCKYSVSSDVKNDSDFEKMIDITNVPERFNHFGYFAGNLSEEMGFTRYRVQTSSSSQSKALPFPYTAEEVERLSKALPKQFDWRVYGAITPKPSTLYADEYAFVAAKAVEGALFIHRGGKEAAVPLSVQAIIDCSWGFGNRGNDGGSAEAAFEWMMKHGLPTDAAYPFKNEQDSCYIDNVEIETKVKGYYKVPSNDVNALKLAIVNHGPVVVMFDHMNMFYSYGIYNETGKCLNDPGSGNRQGLVIGYGSADDQEYWILMIDNGIVQIVTRDNTCGVMNAPIYVTVNNMCFK